MVELKHPEISISKQCDVLSIHRSGLYYTPCKESEYNQQIMNEIDKMHTRWPFYGSRRINAELRFKGFKVGRKLIRRLMVVMGLRVIYPRPNTSKTNKEHKKYPYLLRGVSIYKPNQVWQADITYIAMKRGFMYLMAIIDVHSRFVVHWSISNTMEATWCKEVTEEAFKKHGIPEIFNTDQGSQFTSDVFTGLLIDKQIQISMDGKGRATDNIFIERLWRNVKQEKIYLNAYETVTDLYQGMVEYFNEYNNERGHQSLKYKKPKELYFNAA